MLNMVHCQTIAPRHKQKLAYFYIGDKNPEDKPIVMKVL